MLQPILNPNCPNTADELNDADTPIPMPRLIPAEPARAGLVARLSTSIVTHIM